MNKMFCKRTKKRKVQRELDILDNWTMDLFPDKLYTTFDTTPVQETFSNSIPTSIVNSSFNSNQKQSNLLILENNNNISVPDLVIDDKLLDIYRSKYNKQEDILQSLAQWTVECNVPQNTVNILLQILKYKAELTFIPKDCRTLLCSNSNKVLNLREVKPDGIYYHFGLRNGILRFISILPLSECIQIAVGIDGLPISKSSSSQFWPILAYIMPHHKYVFPIGIFFGNKKPDDSNEYLTDFIAEVLELTTYGITVNNEHKKIEIKIICCDVPAKAFILRVKGHSGYFSCTRCTHEGVYMFVFLITKMAMKKEPTMIML